MLLTSLAPPLHWEFSLSRLKLSYVKRAPEMSAILESQRFYFAVNDTTHVSALSIYNIQCYIIFLHYHFIFSRCCCRKFKMNLLPYCTRFLFPIKITPSKKLKPVNKIDHQNDVFSLSKRLLRRHRRFRPSRRKQLKWKCKFIQQIYLCHH